MLRVLKYLLLILLVAAPVSAKYWDGAAWVDNTCNYYNGSAWVPCDESYYNGTAWVPVNDGGTPPPTDYTLTVTDPGNNDAITCADTDLSVAIDCGNGATDCSATTPIDAEVTGMTATAASGRQFDAWGGDITGAENPTTTPLIMDANKSVTATFSSSGGGGCDDCDTTNDSLQFSELGVVADTDFNVEEWTAWKFTVPSETCVTKTSWVVTDETEDLSSMSSEIYTHDSVNDQPDTAIPETSATVTNLPDEAATVDFVLSATFTLPPGTYWVVSKELVDGVSMLYDSVNVLGTYKYSNDEGVTWEETDYPKEVNVYGCAP